MKPTDVTYPARERNPGAQQSQDEDPQANPSAERQATIMRTLVGNAEVRLQGVLMNVNQAM